MDDGYLAKKRKEATVKTEFDDDNVNRRVVEEDRLSSLPDELLHKIMSSFDIKFVVRTCLLSSRWKLLWTSIPCLNFSSGHFGNLPKFSKFVTKVLRHRNHQIDVSSIQLVFKGSAKQAFVRKVAKYAFSHVQELTVSSRPRCSLLTYPPCLLSSQSLKNFSFNSSHSLCITPQTPLDFPALTTLHLSGISWCGGTSVDIFSKCVNLKNLTLDYFYLEDVKVFDIITPRLSNLSLLHGSKCSTTVINVIAPQLENLRVTNFSFNYLNAPPGLLSLRYWGYPPLQLSKDGFHSLNKVTLYFFTNSLVNVYREEDARKIINMLQKLHSAKYLTLNMSVVECISAFPNLLLHHPSPFSNLICLTIDSSKRNDAYKVKMSTEARNFFLENSPNATFIMELPGAAEDRPT